MVVEQKGVVKAARRALDRQRRFGEKPTISQQKQILKSIKYGYTDIQGQASAQKSVDSNIRLRTTNDIGQNAIYNPVTKKLEEYPSKAQQARQQPLPQKEQQAYAIYDQAPGPRIGGKAPEKPRFVSPGRFAAMQLYQEPLQQSSGFSRYRFEMVSIPQGKKYNSFGGISIEEAQKLGMLQKASLFVKERTGFYRGGSLGRLEAADVYGKEAFPVLYPTVKVGVASYVGGSIIGYGGTLLGVGGRLLIPEAQATIRGLSTSLKVGSLAQKGLIIGGAFYTAKGLESRYTSLRSDSGYSVPKSVGGSLLITGAELGGFTAGFAKWYKPMSEYKILTREPTSAEGAYKKVSVVTKSGVMEKVVGMRRGTIGEERFVSSFVLRSQAVKLRNLGRVVIDENALTFKTEDLLGGKLRVTFRSKSSSLSSGKFMSSGMEGKTFLNTDVSIKNIGRKIIFKNRGELESYLGRELIKGVKGKVKYQFSSYVKESIQQVVMKSDKDIIRSVSKETLFGKKMVGRSMAKNLLVEREMLFTHKYDVEKTLSAGALFSESKSLGVPRSLGKKDSSLLKSLRAWEQKPLPTMDSDSVDIPEPVVNSQAFEPPKSKNFQMREKLGTSEGTGMFPKLWKPFEQSYKRFADPHRWKKFQAGNEQEFVYESKGMSRNTMLKAFLQQRVVTTQSIGTTPKIKLAIGSLALTKSLTGQASKQSNLLRQTQLQRQMQVAKSLQAQKGVQVQTGVLSQMQLQRQVQSQRSLQVQGLRLAQLQLQQQRSMNISMTRQPIRITELPPPPPIKFDTEFKIQLKRFGGFGFVPSKRKTLYTPSVGAIVFDIHVRRADLRKASTGLYTRGIVG